MKVFWNTFKQSVKLPKKEAVFALNRVGMDITVIYLFILLAFASIPALLEQLFVNDPSLQIQTFFLLIYFFIFYYLPLVVIVFSILSFLAYVATVIANLLERKLRYSILWKITAFATTIPLLLFTVVSFFYPLSYLFLLLVTIYVLFIIVKIILIYPKRKKR